MLGQSTIVGISPDEDFATTGAITATYAGAVLDWDARTGEVYAPRQVLGLGQLGFAAASGSDYPVSLNPAWSMTINPAYNREFTEALVASMLPYAAKTGPSGGTYTKTYSLVAGSGAITTTRLKLLARRGRSGTYDGIQGGYIQTAELTIRPGEAATLRLSGAAYRVERNHTPGAAPSLPAGDDDCVIGYQAANIDYGGYILPPESLALAISTGLSGRRTVTDPAPGEPDTQTDPTIMLTLTVSDAAFQDVETEFIGAWQAGVALADDVAVVLTSAVSAVRKQTITLHNCTILSLSAPIATKGALVRTVVLQARASSSKSGITWRFENDINGPY